MDTLPQKSPQLVDKEVAVVSKQMQSLPTTIPSKKTEEYRKINIYLLGTAFCFLVIGVKVAQCFATTLLGNNGAISVAILNYGCAVAYFFVPSILSWFKDSRQSMRFFSVEYGFYILTYAYYIPIFNWIWSCIHGFVASVLWTSQVVFLAENSTDEDRGTKSGIFWGIYMIGSIVGNFFIYWFLKEYGITSTGDDTGWLGTVSIMFLVFAICGFLGIIPIWFYKDPYYGMTAPSRIDNNKTSFMQRFKTVIQDCFTPKYLVTFFLTWFWGYQYAHANGLFNRQVVDRSLVGLLTAYSSVLSVIFSFGSGYLIDKLGHYTVMVLTHIFMLLGLITSYYADMYQNWLLYLAITFFSIADTGYQTIIPVIMTEYFIDAETVNAIFRFMESISLGVGYSIAPAFVEEGQTRATLEMHLYEIYICAGFLVLAQISYSIFIHFYRNDTVTNYMKKKQAALDSNAQDIKLETEMTVLSESSDKIIVSSPGNDKENKNNEDIDISTHICVSSSPILSNTMNNNEIKDQNINTFNPTIGSSNS